MKKLALCAGLAFVFAACTPTIKKEDFCTEYAKATCEVSVKCCTTQSIDSAACNKAVKDFCDKGLLAAVDANKAAYDEAAGADCVSDVRSVGDDCNLAAHQDHNDEACGAAVSGTIPAGGDCKDYPFSCSKGLVCHIKIDNAGNTTSATCEANAKLDEDCTNVSCADGLYCDTATKKCKQQASIGAACGGTDRIDCVDDAYCGPENTCVARKAGGEACTKGEMCKSFTCTNGACEADDAGGFCAVAGQQ